MNWIEIAAWLLLGAALTELLLMTVRVIALRSAVRFLQTPGTNGNVIDLAARMFRFILWGRKL